MAAWERNRIRDNGDRTRATLDMQVEELRSNVLWIRGKAEEIVQEFANRFPEWDVQFDDDFEAGGMEAEAEELQYTSYLQEQCESLEGSEGLNAEGEEEEMENPEEEEVEVEDAV